MHLQSRVRAALLAIALISGSAFQYDPNGVSGCGDPEEAAVWGESLEPLFLGADDEAVAFRQESGISLVSAGAARGPVTDALVCDELRARTYDGLRADSVAWENTWSKQPVILHMSRFGEYFTVAIETVLPPGLAADARTLVYVFEAGTYDLLVGNLLL